MKVLDVNVVLAAYRSDHPHFETARRWLEDVGRARHPYTVTDVVAGSFIRLVTNRRAFADPTPIEAAFSYLGALRAQPSHVLLAPGPRHLALLERLCRDADATGDLVPDAQLAAVAVEHGAEVVSFDRDFARFEGVRWSRP
ncbi:MAG: hypothetical protein AVDCRST_MAG45-992 [uncultured Solirubrobacterales bacterium]|uniref:Ribonuclease VapC n=1 Tax=uncultured Solirubrobacterales bacterium TaxID=768556 RepID=A0A6J4SD46_9ACTN|nr:MAG: hypothetical protein AVDCRST_MAG45-992 [uncultured Solirubrobacterales bacterium]